MDQRIYMNSVRPLHLPNKTPQVDGNRTGSSNQPSAPFSQILKDQITKQEILPLQFSKHAEKRLLSRNIHLDQTRIERLSKAVDQAAAKGARESLLLMDDVAYVVSVKNRLVITAVDDQSMEDNVFTNIDSAVIVR